MGHALFIKTFVLLPYQSESLSTGQMKGKPKSKVALLARRRKLLLPTCVYLCECACCVARQPKQHLIEPQDAPRISNDFCCRVRKFPQDIYKLQAQSNTHSTRACVCACVCVCGVGMTIDMEECYYLVILLPRARASFIDYFACEQRILAGIHLRVHGLLRETLQAFNSCKRERERDEN